MRALPLSVVLVALVATIGVFTFPRPQYHPPGCDGCGKTIRIDDAKPPVNGWRWADPTPGFHLGEHEDVWNMSLLKPREIPAGAGVLVASRTAFRGRPELLFVRRDGCLGVQFRHGAPARLCNLRAAAVVLADEPRPNALFITGVVRSDVTRVVVYAPRETYMDNRRHDHRVRRQPPRLVYDARTPGWWGTFEYSTSRGPVFVAVYGKHGRIATRRIDLAEPGERLYCASALRGVCGMSAQRRS
jgi:hypothetical protein